MRTIGFFSLTMMNIIAIASLRDLPQMASYGLGLIFFYLLAGLLFFIPVSLVSDELATGWIKPGGVYTWVTEALGERLGFLAIFLQWFQNLCWYPVVLTFAGSAFAFFLSPTHAMSLANNKLYIIAFVLLVYWSIGLLVYWSIGLLVRYILELQRSKSFCHSK